ncbi:MarR family winged helix-turn-helix transcriptional regulator [Microbacterium sp. M1A1_1b]
MNDRNDVERHVLDGFPDSALRFFRALEAERARVAARHGLSEFDLRALFRISAVGSMTPKQLAVELAVTKAAITGLSTRLVDAGFVRRAEHPADRRSLHLELTRAGHEAMRVAHDDFRVMLSAAGTAIDDDELETARRVLDALERRLAERARAGGAPAH